MIGSGGLVKNSDEHTDRTGVIVDKGAAAKDTVVTSLLSQFL